VGRNVTLSTPPKPSDPGYTINTFSSSEQDAYLKQYREKYPESRPTTGAMPSSQVQVFEPPPHYSDHVDHHLNFAMSVRSRKPVVEDATFGFRAAGPAVLSNISYFENRVVEWDPQTMKIKA
jgi:hypothetical protein